MATKAEEKSKSPEDLIAEWTNVCHSEAQDAKRSRMDLNRKNFDTFNMKGDFSHKKAGQSREFLPRQTMATEQITSFIQQALTEAGEDWFKIEAEPGTVNPPIKPEEITKILRRAISKLNFPEVVGDSLKMGLLGALLIAKVHGRWVPKNIYRTEQKMVGEKVQKQLMRQKKMVWELQIDLIRQEDWYPDPTGRGLYFIQEIEMDLHEVIKLSEGENAIYDAKMVEMLVGGTSDAEQESKKARETNQNQTFTDARKRVKIRECYGTILDMATGKVVYENVTWTVANDVWVIGKPKPYPFWHGQDPFVVAEVMRVPKSVWHKAPMDAPSALNQAMNELFNLELDRGLMSVFGIRQLRTAWLSDETQVNDGIGPGATLEVNDLCPPGAKVLEPVQTAIQVPEGMQSYQALSSEFQVASMSNDLRMGVLPSRAVKATEVVEASQTITSIFTGMAKNLEDKFVMGIMKKAWPTVAQHINDLDSAEVAALLGADRAKEIAGIGNEELFAGTAEGFKYKVYGISTTLNKMKDFKKITALLQTIGASEMMIEEFIKRYDFGKLLTEVMRSLDIDVDRIALSKQEQEAMAAAQAQQQGAVQQGSQPNAQSQIPQMAGGQMKPEGNPGGPQPAEGSVPGTKFPPSRALQVRQ